MFERTEQLAALDDQWARLRATGRGRLALVKGEAGAGKTSLVKHFGQRSVGRPTVLSGACDPWFTGRPFGPFLDIAHRADATVRTPALDAVLPGGRPRRGRLGAFERRGSRGPAIVVLEDFHWADEATLDVLRLVARRVEFQPTLVLVTYRDDELHRTHPLRIVLGDIASGLLRVPVPLLSETAVASLAQSTKLDSAELYRKTGGNPFFVTEVLAAGAGGGLTSMSTIPDTVRDAWTIWIASISVWSDPEPSTEDGAPTSPLLWCDATFSFG